MRDLPDVSSPFGAPKGRPNRLGNRDAVNFDMQRLRWVDGDYDEGGAYWGYVQGTHIYRAQSEDGDQVAHVRASSYEEAQKLVREEYFPDAVFSEDSNLDAFVEAYREAALFSSSNTRCDEEGREDEPEFLAESDYELTEETEEAMRSDCRQFLQEHGGLLESAFANHRYSVEQAGHDFWFTRNGHGAGFWDRGLDELGDKLSDAAKRFGEVDLYVGDDDMIHDTSVPREEPSAPAP